MPGHETYNNIQDGHRNVEATVNKILISGAQCEPYPTPNHNCCQEGLEGNGHKRVNTKHQPVTLVFDVFGYLTAGYGNHEVVQSPERDVAYITYNDILRPGRVE